MEKKEDRLLIFCGDIHGKFEKLVWTIVVKRKLSNCDIIICGDFGVGFEKPGYLENLYKSVRTRLNLNDINIYVVRGNHDNPDYFKDGSYNKERLIFLVDHVPININGRIIYPIGGATSIDKNERILINSHLESKRKSNRVWWEDEEIIENKLSLPNKVDYIVSHEAPISFEPVLIREHEDVEIYNSIKRQREYLDWVVRNLPAERWFHGHYHKSSSGNFGNLKYRGLAIEELIEIR